MGRAAFLWPPQGEASLTESERAEWTRLHTVIRRATEEKVAERYVDFRTMATAAGTDSAGSAEKQDECNVIITNTGLDKISLIKAIREVAPGLGLADAKRIVESIPTYILEGVARDAAEAAKKKLEEAGAKIELT
jgi:large subunit ribosomal protein L7/L12